MNLLSLVRNQKDGDIAVSVATGQERLVVAAKAIEELAQSHAEDFKSFEVRLRELLWTVGRLAVTLFLAHRQQRSRRGAMERDGRHFRPAPAQARNLNTIFGVVRYSRTYMREVVKSNRHGFYPLDEELGLTGERISFNLLVLAARLALKLSFSEARATLGAFVPTPPSTEVVEQTVLGLGRYTSAYIESAPAPAGDGDVLVIQIDSKGAPTATDSELKRRRGPREKKPKRCPRHRGRSARALYGRKPRPDQGDKSKNAKMATMVLMYTLRKDKKGDRHGPINTWRYASFAPKRHAFAIALREATKRGFGIESGKLVQLLTDGDNDLALYGKELLPHALHTIDAMHVVEKLWLAGDCLFRDGDPKRRPWVEARKDELYKGEATKIVAHLQRRLDETAKTGPGNKGKRKRLAAVIYYISRRLPQLQYHRLLAEDLDLSTGAIEGAIKNVIGKRCDYGGMRWIRERVEAIVQLRCIEANGEFERFAAFVHREIFEEHHRPQTLITRLQSATPANLPTYGVAA